MIFSIEFIMSATISLISLPDNIIDYTLPSPIRQFHVLFSPWESCSGLLHSV